MEISSKRWHSIHGRCSFTALLLLVVIIGNIDAQSCGGNYTTDYGIFMSPNYPDVYTLNVTCIYRIIPSAMSSITVTFETFELDRAGEDTIVITCESDPDYPPRLFTWHASLAPVPMPNCSIGTVYFESGPSHLYSTRGFRVQYQVSTKGCGKTVFEANMYEASSSGTISSPNYPQNYNNDENCTYSIWAKAISSFTLSFEAFDLEPDCQRDWVQIRCDNDSYILPKYCGSTLPKPAYITNCGTVLIWFHTDNATVSSGFSLQYSVTPNGCGKLNYAGISGIITSPNYPKDYDGLDCTYNLYPVSSVAFAFQTFDLEPFIDDDWYREYVQIECYSNSSYGSSQYYGNTLPPLISYTLCSHVRISFRSNLVLSGPGFILRYQVNPLVAHSAITNAPQNFTVDVGSRVQLDCTSDATDYYSSWTLSKDGTEENTTVIASFCVLNSGYNSTYSVVKGGPGVCSLVITNTTLAEAGVYTCIDVGLASISSVVTVVDPTTTSTSSGQVPTTTSTPTGEGCGVTYTEDYGVFMSPNYPDVYTLNVECIYRITPSTMSSITLSFETFELDRSAGDYVLITCESDTGYVPRNFSWNANIAPISMPSCSIAQLYFHSDSSHSYATRGFRVQYQVDTEGCGNTVFEASSGTISSPNYPQNYNDDENCTYSISASQISSFTLTFEAFDLEADCRFDWVQIRCDSSSYISPKYCGSTLPRQAYITNCNKVLIWFHSDSSSVYSGFSLQYSVTANGCGKSDYGGLSGIITSPNYPNGYDGMECYYYLYPVSSVTLVFQSFDLEPFIDDSYGDYFQSECYSNSSSGYIRYHGNTLPPLISYTLCSHVRIHFNANWVLSGTGFNVRYQANPLVAHSAITNAPTNFTVDVGSRVQLDCSSNAKDYYPSWTLSKDGTEENTATIASFCDVNPGHTSQYEAVKDGPGFCNLVIKSATLAQAGVYTCIDVGLASISSVVAVVDLQK